jgi:hypothetical protein
MEKLCKQATNMLIEEFQKDETQSKIQEKVLNPITNYIANRLYPYIIGASALLVLLLLILIYIMYMIVKINRIHQS